MIGCCPVCRRAWELHEIPGTAAAARLRKARRSCWWIGCWVAADRSAVLYENLGDDVDARVSPSDG